MILGHFAVALAAKRAVPRASLGTAIFAAQLLDLLWPPFLLLGIERVRVVPGLMAASPLEFVHYPYSHSLLAATGWALLLAAGYYAARRYPAGAGMAGVLVVSHWFLDAPMHRPDLPLWPGSELLVGGGLWSSVPATVAVEISLLAVGFGVYLRCTRASDGIGRWGPWSLVAFLLMIFLGGLAGSAPPDPQAVGIGALGLWLFVPWGYWIDRHRTSRASPGGEPREASGARGRGRAPAAARSSPE